jgi:multiple sugar transport system permease protein
MIGSRLNKSQKIFSNILLFLWILFALFPIYWMVMASFKAPLAIHSGGKILPFINFKPTLETWKSLLFGANQNVFLSRFMNSLIVTISSSVLALIFGALGAYGLERFSYRYGPLKNENLSLLIISQRMMPPIVASIAVFVFFRYFKLLDTRLGLIISYLWFNLPLAVFLLMGFFRDIPKEIEDAASIDGCGKFRQFWLIALPLTFPGLVATFLVCFIFAWNEFLLALILTFNTAMTLPIMVSSLDAEMEPMYWLIGAVGVVVILPSIFVSLVLDKYLVGGLRIGGIK